MASLSEAREMDSDGRDVCGLEEAAAKTFVKINYNSWTSALFAAQQNNKNNETTKTTKSSSVVSADDILGQ